MKPGMQLLLSVFVSVLIVLLALQYLPLQPSGNFASTSELNALNQRITALIQSQQNLADTARKLESKMDTISAQNSGIPSAEIENALAKWMSANASRVFGTREAVAAPAKEIGSAKSASATTLNLEQAIADLWNDNIPWNDREKIWSKVKEQGLIEQVVAAFEKRAEETPNNPEVQFELGYAYIQKLQTINDGMEKGTWAVKADSCFDTALKLDEKHWGARFSKAISLSFWPPVFGKQNEAIHHFETLVKQQETMPAQPEFIETYLYLGNMYQQQGNVEKAREAWQKGLTAFPNNEELQKQIQLIQPK